LFQIAGLAGDHFGRAMALRGRVAPNMMWAFRRRRASIFK
jgi:hypothetical protein